VSTVPADAERKEIDTLIAKFARAGFSVYRLDRGGFLVCRWNSSKFCPGMHELSAFARLVGAR
jgi:hypothetical protein